MNARSEHSERAMLSVDLRRKYLPDVPDQIAERVFAKAWEDGHANGAHEVEIQYDEIATIARKAFRAGRIHKARQER